MERKNSDFLRLLETILGFTLLASLIMSVVGLVFQWNTRVQFSNGFFIAGAIIIVLGTFSVTGGFRQRANFPLTYAETASQASISERGKRMLADINQRDDFDDWYRAPVDCHCYRDPSAILEAKPNQDVVGRYCRPFAFNRQSLRIWQFVCVILDLQRLLPVRSKE